MRRYILIVVLLSLFSLPAFAEQELLISVTGARATSLTDTRIKPLMKFGVDFFPGGKNVAVSYDFLYRHPNFFTMKPFTADHREAMHSLALVVRFRSEGRLQPMFRAGAMRYVGHTTVRRFEETLFEASNGKTIPVVSFRVGIQVWKGKGFMVIPEAGASGVRRPQYN